MPENPRKEAFKAFIMEELRNAPHPRDGVTKKELVAAVKREHPELTDDSEACYPGCQSAHPKWRHEFDRCIYDLGAATPPLIRHGSGRGTYILGR
jgi:hypothetical protein